MAKKTPNRIGRIVGWLIAIVLLAAIGLVAYKNWQQSANAPVANEPADMPPPNVVLHTTNVTDLVVEREYAGRAQGARQVEVRARVQGILQERLYQEGELVTQGDPLFRIDPDPFKAELQSAVGELETARAELRRAEREWDRVTRLFERGVSSEQDRDNTRSALELAKARTTVAQANVTQAELELSYTQVQAPVSGVTSLEAVPEGSLVSVGSLLTSIVQQNPIHVRFALPEDDAAVQRAARQAMGQQADGEHRYQAKLLMPDGHVYEHLGEVDFTASIIDPRTGTVSARAVFPNPQTEIIPGQFVRVRVPVQRLEQVIVIPQKAVAQGPQGTQVFVVDDQHTAHAQPVTLGPVVPAGQVVLEGLSANQQVVISGHVTLADGMQVQVIQPQPDAETPTDTDNAS